MLVKKDSGEMDNASPQIFLLRAFLDQCREDLLNTGYSIVSTEQGSVGSATFTLRDVAGSN